LTSVNPKFLILPVHLSDLWQPYFTVVFNFDDPQNFDFYISTSVTRENPILP